jgi:hypothetical protein
MTGRQPARTGRPGYLVLGGPVLPRRLNQFEHVRSLRFLTVAQAEGSIHENRMERRLRKRPWRALVTTVPRALLSPMSSLIWIRLAWIM